MSAERPEIDLSAPAGLEPELGAESFATGRCHPPVAFVLSDEFVDAYLAATGEHHPLHARDGPGFAPPLATTVVRLAKAAIGGRWPSGTLQLDHRIVVRRPLRRGERLTIDARIVEAEERDGRFRFTLASTVLDTHGEPVVEQTSRSLWAGALAAPAQAAARGPGPGAPAIRNGDRPAAPREPAATRAEADPALGELPGRFRLDALCAYGRVAGALDPIHVDPGFGRGTRFGTNVVQGRLAMTLPWRLMLARLGEDWLARGELAVRFVAPVRVDEPLVARAAGLPGDARGFEVWCEDATGARPIVGTARLSGSHGPP